MTMSPNDSGEPQLTTAVDSINSIFRRVQASISRISELYIDLRSSQFTSLKLKHSDHERIAEELESTCKEVLLDPQNTNMVGAGLVWIDQDDSSGMIWWRIDNNRAARKYHVFNPASDSFYDYRNSNWYRDALQSDGLTIFGPYIDAWGTDDHTLTGAMRISRPNGLEDVAAADLDVQSVVDELHAQLLGLHNWVLVGSEDRVVASDVAGLSPGLRLGPYLKSAQREIVSSRSVDVAGWVLIQLDEVVQL